MSRSIRNRPSVMSIQIISSSFIIVKYFQEILSSSVWCSSIQWKFPDRTNHYWHKYSVLNSFRQNMKRWKVSQFSYNYEAAYWILYKLIWNRITFYSFIPMHIHRITHNFKITIYQFIIYILSVSNKEKKFFELSSFIIIVHMLENFKSLHLSINHSFDEIANLPEIRLPTESY